MAIDRRIVSILYHNGITDVNEVQEFIGEKNNYYEIKINNEIKKLKIPGYSYFDVTEIKIENVVESVEEPKVEEPKVEEPKVEEPKKATVKKTTKSKKETKKVDDDIDDFINLA